MLSRRSATGRVGTGLGRATAVAVLSLVTSVVVGLGPVSAGDVDPTLNERILNEVITPRIGSTYGQIEQRPPRYALSGDPATLADVGLAILSVDSALIDLGGRQIGETDLATPHLPLLADVVTGVPAWFNGQLSLRAVWGRATTSPDLADASVAEVSIAFALPGFERLVQSPFEVEPNDDRSINVGLGSFEGESQPSQSFVSGGSFVPSSPTMPITGGYTADGWFFFGILPGTATDVRVIAGGSRDGSAETLAVSWVDVSEPTAADSLEDAPFSADAVQSGLELTTRDEHIANRASADAESPAPSEPPPAGDPGAQAGEATDESEPADQPPVDDESEPVAPEPGEIAAPTEENAGASGATTTTATTTTTISAGPVEGDESDDGLPAWLKFVLPAGVVAFIVLLLALWRRATRTAKTQGAGSESGTGTTDGSGDRHGRGNTGSGTPPAEGSESTTETPLVPGTPPQPPAWCDWELWFGSTKLKAAEPGHQACCVYRVEIETTRDPDKNVARAYISDERDGRRKIVGLDATGDGLDLAARATTGSEPDDRSDLDDGGANEGTTVSDWAQLGGPAGLRPDVASHLRIDDTTEVSVTLTSKCRDHQHVYDGKVDSTVELTAGRQCTNDAPDDRCDVHLRALGKGGARVEGDLALAVGCEIGGDTDELREDGPQRRDPHDHARRGERSTSQDESATDDPVERQAFGWSASFHNEISLDAGQIVPPSARPNTEAVVTRATGDARHGLTLKGETKGRSCAGGACGCGATQCQCEPAFELEINRTKQELRVDDRLWTLARGRDGTGPWTAS